MAGLVPAISWLFGKPWQRQSVILFGVWYQTDVPGAMYLFTVTAGLGPAVDVAPLSVG
jgi:hypothetical protein